MLDNIRSSHNIRPVPRCWWLSLLLGSLPVASSLVLRPVLRPTGKAAARAGDVQCWAGKSEATIEIQDVPAEVLYNGYADLRRMTEWSPLLESVTPYEEQPHLSVWVMKVPRALRWAAQQLGYLDEDAKPAGRRTSTRRPAADAMDLRPRRIWQAQGSAKCGLRAVWRGGVSPARARSEQHDAAPQLRAS